MSKARSSRSPDAEPAPSRHPYGPRSLAAVLPDVTRAAFARRPAAVARLLADWALIVGAGLAARTQPLRLVAGTLTVACAGPVAMELQHGADVLMERINRHMGQALVQRLRLVQQTVLVPAAIAVAPGRAVDVAAIERRLAGVPAGPVRDALAALACAMQAGGGAGRCRTYYRTETSSRGGKG